ncbi:MAG: hypothetical protein LKE46_08370 [Clostridium sp.]|jgi:hypothetical protein|uniref:hypothetical protein n=1 Tax=Clostridium sp. TaxID=1506 RepID=UPI0025BD659D|nr:hypothetical protein [Clostridium sp.]MCH3964281.1 hypothetical protein [Clostridium sp.]
MLHQQEMIYIYNIINQNIINSEPVQITSKNGDVIMLSAKDAKKLESCGNVDTL